MMKGYLKSTALTLIQNNEELAQVCQLKLVNKSAVALDTPIYAKFIDLLSLNSGLIQLYDGERVSLIDPLIHY